MKTVPLSDEMIKNADNEDVHILSRAILIKSTKRFQVFVNGTLLWSKLMPQGMKSQHAEKLLLMDMNLYIQRLKAKIATMKRPKDDAPGEDHTS